MASPISTRAHRRVEASRLALLLVAAALAVLMALLLLDGGAPSVLAIAAAAAGFGAFLGACRMLGRV
ncbi:hypothetical protein [Pseudactinotalea sp.]|uniref:hypothetical protein n=1 Tax=Pseudactinotalea sp. TaxID=1926260 RepID=UPI003B3AFEEC